MSARGLMAAFKPARPSGGDRMHSQVMIWLDAASDINSLPAFKSTLDAWIHQLGFQFFVYRGRFPSSTRGADEMDLDTTPAAWRDYCDRRGMDTRWDPLYSRALHEVTPILWCKVKPLHPDLFEKAREFGLATGVTQPLHGPAGQWSSLSFIKDRAGLRAERDVLAVLPQCQLLASLAHDAGARIIARRQDTSIAPHSASGSSLSERENECLGLAALGKTIQQISGILPISERTVAFHLANARSKLHAGSLRHAVTRAVSLGLIRVA